jgi:hypothetical protein
MGLAAVPLRRVFSSHDYNAFTPNMNPERPDDWVFFHDLLGGWRWERRRGGKTAGESTQSYATREACIADAERNGFAGASAASQVPRPRSLSGRFEADF